MATALLVMGLATVSFVAPGAAQSVPDDGANVSTAAAAAREAAPLVPVAVTLRSNEITVLEVEAELRQELAGMVCPLRGTVRFYDDFGNPRSGGRDHQGNDLMSDHGVEVVAVVDGAVDYKSGSRQGRGAYLRGEDGNEYWYFHLSDYEGEPRLVRQGDVIGYAGETGNAGGTHTHFEVHPAWDPYEVVNPYPRLDLVCTDRVPMR